MEHEKSLVIAAVLMLLGVSVSWYSINKIAGLSAPPTRYDIWAKLRTTGCGERDFELTGSIGSFGASILAFRMKQNDSLSLPDRGCWVDSIELESNARLEPVSWGGESSLFRIAGGGKSEFDLLGLSTEALHEAGQRLPEIAASTEDGELLLQSPDDLPQGVEISYRAVPRSSGDIDRAPGHYYAVSFAESWQPREAIFFFAPTDSINTYFDIVAHHNDRPTKVVQWKNEEAAPTGIGIEFRTDDVSVIRGSVSESGEALGVDGRVRFGVENNDAESKRESGNITYSALLGIGIAALMEAFVLILAVGIFAIRRPGTAA